MCALDVAVEIQFVSKGYSHRSHINVHKYKAVSVCLQILKIEQERLLTSVTCQSIKALKTSTQQDPLWPAPLLEYKERTARSQ